MVYYTQPGVYKDDYDGDKGFGANSIANCGPRGIISSVT